MSLKAEIIKFESFSKEVAKLLCYILYLLHIQLQLNILFLHIPSQYLANYTFMKTFWNICSKKHLLHEKQNFSTTVVLETQNWCNTFVCIWFFFASSEPWKKFNIVATLGSGKFSISNKKRALFLHHVSIKGYLINFIFG